MVAPRRLSADRTGECYKSLPQEQRTDSVADSTLPAPRSDAPAPPYNKVEVGIPLGLTTSVDKGNLPSSTPTPGDGQGPGQSNSEQAQSRAELALLIRWLSDRRPTPSPDGQDVAQHWISLGTFLESDWNEVDWHGVESREDGYLYALEGYWHRLRHARKRPQLYGPLAVPSALVDVELDSVCALAEAISSGDRSSELELAKRLTDRELQLKTEADEQYPCSTCSSPPDSSLDQEGEGERAAPPAHTYGSLIRNLWDKQGHSANGQAAVTNAAFRLAQASESALDAQLAASTRKHGCLSCFRVKRDRFPTIRRLYERRTAELAAEIAAERRTCSTSDHGSDGLDPPPSVHRRDSKAEPAGGMSGSNEDSACSLSDLATAASNGYEIVRIEPVHPSSDGSCPSAEDLDPARLVSPSAVGSSPSPFSVTDSLGGMEKERSQHEPSLLLFHSSPEPDQTGNRHSCSVDCGVPSVTQEEFENVLPVEEDIPPDIHASPSPPSGVSNFPDLLFGSIHHHDILCLLSTRVTTTFAIGKRHSCTVDRSKPSPASIRPDVPVSVHPNAHGSPSLLLSSSVAFEIGCVAASVTRRASATIARTDSTGVSARSLAAGCEQHASFAPAVLLRTAPVKLRPKALQRMSLSVKVKHDSIQSFYLRPARQDIAFGSLFLDNDPQSRASKCGTHSTAPSAFKGPLGSNAGGTSSSVAWSAPTKKAPDKRFLRPVQPTGMNLSSVFTSPSTSLTPLEPTGPGPPSFGRNRTMSFPDAPSKSTSGLHYACNRSTARGGRVSVDELGRSIVSKLHRTDIEQSRITTDLKHHYGIGVPTLPVAEQTRGGSPAMQQQQAGVSHMSLKVGRDPQGVKVYATVDTMGQADSSSLGGQPMLEIEVEGGSVAERVAVNGAMTEGAMTEGAMTEGAVKGGVVAGGDEHVRPVVKEVKRLGSLTEVIVPCGSVRTKMQSETRYRPLLRPLATRVPYSPTIDPQPTATRESQLQRHSRGAASRVAALTAAATLAAPAPSLAAANDALRASCPGISLESREVQPVESRRRPRVAAEAAAGAASVVHVSCPGAVGPDHRGTKSCELLFSPSATANTLQGSRHGTADHIHGDVKSCRTSFSPAQPHQRRPANAAQEWGTTPWGAQQMEGAEQEGAEQEGAEQEGAEQMEVLDKEGARQEGSMWEGVSGVGSFREGASSRQRKPALAVLNNLAANSSDGVATTPSGLMAADSKWQALPPSASPRQRTPNEHATRLVHVLSLRAPQLVAPLRDKHSGPAVTAHAACIHIPRNTSPASHPGQGDSAGSVSTIYFRRPSLPTRKHHLAVAYPTVECAHSGHGLGPLSERTVSPTLDHSRRASALFRNTEAAKDTISTRSVPSLGCLDSQSPADEASATEGKATHDEQQYLGSGNTLVIAEDSVEPSHFGLTVAGSAPTRDHTWSMIRPSKSQQLPQSHVTTTTSSSTQISHREVNLHDILGITGTSLRVALSDGTDAAAHRDLPAEQASILILTSTSSVDHGPQPVAAQKPKESFCSNIGLVASAQADGLLPFGCCNKGRDGRVHEGSMSSDDDRVSLSDINCGRTRTVGSLTDLFSNPVPNQQQLEAHSVQQRALQPHGSTVDNEPGPRTRPQGSHAQIGARSAQDHRISSVWILANDGLPLEPPASYGSRSLSRDRTSVVPDLPLRVHIHTNPRATPHVWLVDIGRGFSSVMDKHRLSVRVRRECWKYAPARAVRFRLDGDGGNGTKGATRFTRTRKGQGLSIRDKAPGWQ